MTDPHAFVPTTGTGRKDEECGSCSERADLIVHARSYRKMMTEAADLLNQSAIDLIVAEYESTHPLDHKARVRTESREGGRRYVAACVCGWTGLFAWRGRAKAQGEADDHEAHPA